MDGLEAGAKRARQTKGQASYTQGELEGGPQSKACQAKALLSAN